MTTTFFAFRFLATKFTIAGRLDAVVRHDSEERRDACPSSGRPPVADPEMSARTPSRTGFRSSHGLALGPADDREILLSETNFRPTVRASGALSWCRLLTLNFVPFSLLNFDAAN